MNIKYFEKKEAAVDYAAQIMYDQIKSNPKSVLGLATGNTFEPVYYDFVGKIQGTDGRLNLNLSAITTYNLDEYVNVADKDQEQSYYHYMNFHLFRYTDIDLKKTNFPNHYSEDFRTELTFPEFENSIRKIGGIDLQFLGVGTNGHIGFNEPGSSINSVTRCVMLSQATINVNSRKFANPADMPRKAVTMGIKTILESGKKIVLVALGREKEAALRQLVNAKAYDPN